MHRSNADSFPPLACITDYSKRAVHLHRRDMTRFKDKAGLAQDRPALIKNAQSWQLNHCKCERASRLRLA
ncbi:hypothetical protein PSAB6_50116 [Paraburkholderia sabiae]|nr:hypothetical protein PSAB6_50116 [Paraburkholderia sabiae]